MKKQVLETLPFLRGQDAEHIQEAKALFEKRCREYRELRKNGIRFIMARESRNIRGVLRISMICRCGFL